MTVELKVPSAGESVVDVEIGEWLKSEGDHVERDETIVRLETDKASMEVPAPAAGTLAAIRKTAGDVVEIGEVIAEIDTDGEGPSGDAGGSEEEQEEAADEGDADREGAPASRRGKSRKARDAQDDEDTEDAEKAEGGGDEEADEDADDRAVEHERSNDVEVVDRPSAERDEAEEEEPRARRGRKGEPSREDGGDEERADEDDRSRASRRDRARPEAEKGSDEDEAEAAEGSGEREQREQADQRPRAGKGKRDGRPKGPGKPGAKERAEGDRKGAERAEPRAKDGEDRRARPHDGNGVADERPRERVAASSDDEVVPMSRLRRTIARRLVESQQRSALLSTFQEIEMTALLDLRRRWGPAFEERHGTSLGIMSFFVKAVIEALKEVPELNAEISGDDIVYHHRYHVGIAVGSERGLVVPVLRDADRMSLAAIEEAIDDFAERAETGALELDELRDGTFTITNGGVFGSLLSTPIVNPPQSGVLGMHAIEERPIARDGAVAVRPMMYTALTYDHRIVDGRESVRFLMRVKELIEAPERLLLEA